MKIVVVTGMSGAGKSTVLNLFEDLDYYCIDNMPPELLVNFAEFILHSDSEIERLCVAVDIRSGELFSKFEESISALRRSGADVTVLFIDCDDTVLMNRYKETRRRHPLEEEASGNLPRAIAMERKEIAKAQELADIYIDSSDFKAAAFRARIMELFQNDAGEMYVNVCSFGFMFGIPKEADLVFDVRGLKNPFHVAELKSLTGLDAPVYDYVFSFDDSNEVYAKIIDLVTYLLPLYEADGKPRVTIAFGCTGGKHRSVSFARRLAEDLSLRGFNARAEHRDVER